MLAIAIDAVALIVLMKALIDEEMGFWQACLIALVASIGTTVLAGFLMVPMGLAGVILAALIGAVLVGVAISALFGAEIKRACLVGGLFTLIHIAVSVGFSLLLRR